MGIFTPGVPFPPHLAIMNFLGGEMEATRAELKDIKGYEDDLTRRDCRRLVQDLIPKFDQPEP